MSMQLTSQARQATAEIEKMQTRPCVIIVTRRGILRETIPNLEKTRPHQKTSNSFGNLCSNN